MKIGRSASVLGTSIQTEEIDDLAVTTAKLAASAVTLGKMGSTWSDYLYRAAAFGGTDETAVGSGTTSYMPLDGDLAPNATEANVRMRALRPGTVSSCAIRISANAALTGGTATFRVNGADTAMVVAVGAGATGIFWLDGAVPALVAGDSFDVKFVSGVGGVTTISGIQARIEWAIGT